MTNIMLCHNITGDKLIHVKFWCAKLRRDTVKSCRAKQNIPQSTLKSQMDIGHSGPDLSNDDESAVFIMTVKMQSEL